MSDYYQILGLDRSASEADIKNAYRKLAMKHHPDRGGDVGYFQEIQSAYATLSDPQKRAEYDNPRPQFNQGPGGFHFHTGGMPEGFEQFFHHFGFGFQQPRANRAIQLQTSISLEDAFYGKDLIASVGMPSGREQTVNINIPKGMHSGTTLKLAGMGDDSIPGIPRGDILLNVHIHDHPKYKRQGDDLIVDVDVNCIDAMLGGEVNVISIDGKTLATTIPAKIQHDAILSIPGYGMPNFNDSNRRGRLLLKIKITIPEINDIQRATLEKIKI